MQWFYNRYTHVLPRGLRRFNDANRETGDVSMPPVGVVSAVLMADTIFISISLTPCLKAARLKSMAKSMLRNISFFGLKDKAFPSPQQKGD